MENGSLRNFIKTEKFKEAMKNTSLWDKKSNYFTKKDYEVSEENRSCMQRFLFVLKIVTFVEFF